MSDPGQSNVPPPPPPPPPAYPPPYGAAPPAYPYGSAPLPYAQHGQPGGGGGGGAVTGLAIGSLVVGVLALAFALVPFCGMVAAVPLALVGATLGIIAIVLAATGKRAGVAFPIVGVAVNVAAVVLGGVIFRAVTQRAASAVQQVATQAQQNLQQAQQRMADEMAKAAAAGLQSQVELEDLDAGRPGATTRPADADAPPAPAITPDKYERLRDGMTREQVAAVLGAPGVERRRVRDDGTGPGAAGGDAPGDTVGETTVYSWRAADGARVYCTFRDGKLVARTTAGLQ